MGSVGQEIHPALQEPGKEVTGGRSAVFLDRDGTVNEEVDFVRTPEEMTLIPGAAAAIRSLNERGLITCVISNQSGIARGYFSEDDLARIHARLAELLGREDARIDRIYYCPHHPTEGTSALTTVCACRKPAPGMLLQAAAELGIDLRRSYVVGDRAGDIEAARNVGATAILVLTGYGPTALAECRSQSMQPDHVAASITDAAEWITHHIKGETRKNV